MKKRELTYAQAINEALEQSLQLSEDVVVFGQLADTPSGIFGTTTGLAKKFGKNRVQDFQVAENLMTSAALGAALTGFRPVLVHQRMDFMVYSLDAIANWMALWNFKSNGKSSVPVTIRTVIGKGWGQGPQHSKSFHAWMAHLPGLRVAMPATAFDAKGLLMESIFSEVPAIFIEGRPLFSHKTEVPKEPYRVHFGKAAIRKPGKDVTIVAMGLMVPQMLRVASELEKDSIDAEIIDLRTISPWDREAVFESVSKTGRLLVADPGWNSFSAAAEIIASTSENAGDKLKALPGRVTLPDSHTPMSCELEKAYYLSEGQIVQTVKKMFS